MDLSAGPFVGPPVSSHSISGHRCNTRHGWQQKWQQHRQPRGLPDGRGYHRWPAHSPATRACPVL